METYQLFQALQLVSDEGGTLKNALDLLLGKVQVGVYILTHNFARS
jgi:hypothetical protein